MKSLLPHLPYRDGETPVSFVGRLSARHGIHDTKLLCHMLGVPFWSVARGEPEALDTLARLAGVDAAALRRSAVRFHDRRSMTFRGEALSTHAIHRGRPRICPVCVAEDLSNSTVPASAAAHCRTLWTLAALRTCTIHRVALIEIGLAPEMETSGEFTRRIAPCLQDVERLAVSAVRQDPSDLETYLLRRLDSDRGQRPWLDGQDWYVASRLCEMVGLVHLYGREALVGGRTDAEWHAAGQAGFSLVADGPEALHAFLSGMYESFPQTSGSPLGCSRVLGTLYMWLYFKRHAPAFDHLVSTVAASIFRIMPLGAGHKVFNAQLDVRLLHSIHTLSLQTGRHPRPLRKILKATGIIEFEWDERSNHNLILDAAASEAAVARYAAGLTSHDIPAVLGCSVAHAKRLIAAGFLKPIRPFADVPELALVYERSAVLTLRAALLEDARPLDEVPPHLCDIGTAARIAGCTVKTIVELVLGKVLTTVCLDRNLNGYAAILVDPREIRAESNREGRGPIRLADAARKLGVSRCVAGGLVRAKVLLGRVGNDPASRRRVYLIDAAELEAFRKRYVAGSELARDTGASHWGVVKFLTALGIPAAFPPNVCGATFYVRPLVERPDIRAELETAILESRRRWRRGPRTVGTQIEPVRSGAAGSERNRAPKMRKRREANSG